MTTETNEQPPITDLIDAAIGRIVDDDLNPAVVYLTPEDYERYAAERTRIWRARTGSSALMWPLSHDDLLLVSVKALAELLEIPVRQRHTLNGIRSAVYASNGCPYMVELP